MGLAFSDGMNSFDDGPTHVVADEGSLYALGKEFKLTQSAIRVISVDSKSKSYLAIAMGIVILLADVYWLMVGSSYTYPPWLAAGIIIFVADLVWLWVDHDLMKK